MQISEPALIEFMRLYEAEFGEELTRDSALIMARNLVMFYEDLYQAGVLQAANELEDGIESQEPKDA